MRPRSYLGVACVFSLGIISLLCTARLWAQQMPLGGVQLNVPVLNCADFQAGGTYSYVDFDPTITQCYQGILVDCPNVDDLSFVFGVAPPSPDSTPRGTIVLLTGDGAYYAGTQAFQLYAPYYEGQGYQVVEIAWGAPPAWGKGSAAWELARWIAPTGTNERRVARPLNCLSNH